MGLGLGFGVLGCTEGFRVTKNKLELETEVRVSKGL